MPDKQARASARTPPVPKIGENTARETMPAPKVRASMTRDPPLNPKVQQSMTHDTPLNPKVQQSMTHDTPLNPKVQQSMTRHTPPDSGTFRKIYPQQSRKSNSHRSPRLRSQVSDPKQSLQMPDLPRRPPSRKHCGPGYAATTAMKPRCFPRPRRRRSRRRYASASPCRPRRRDRNRLPVRAGTTTPR